MDQVQGGYWGRLDKGIEPALAVIIALLVVFWSSGLPPVIGMQLYAEQILIAVLSFAAAICFLGTDVRGKRRAIGTAPMLDRLLAYGPVAGGIGQDRYCCLRLFRLHLRQCRIQRRLHRDHHYSPNEGRRLSGNNGGGN